MATTETENYKLDLGEMSESREADQTKLPPSFFAYLGEPWGALGKVEIEREAWLYAKALSLDGDRWWEIPFSRAQELVPEMRDWSPNAAAALAWVDNPLTMERAKVIWKKDV